MIERWQLIGEVAEFLEDMNCRPHFAIQTRVTGTCGIPKDFIKKDGLVVLNVSRRATGDSLRIGMYQCAADLTFNGQHYSVAFHPDAVVAVYSPDGGPKLVFPNPDLAEAPAQVRPKLSVVGGSQ